MKKTKTTKEQSNVKEVNAYCEYEACQQCCCHRKSILRKLKPIANICTRTLLAATFFLHGLARIQDWGTTLELFKNEYKITLINSELAAQIFTFSELALAPLLFIGFGTRYVALFLLGILVFVAATHKASGDIYQMITMLGMLMTYGGSKISVDHLIYGKNNCKCCSSNANNCSI